MDNDSRTWRLASVDRKGTWHERLGTRLLQVHLQLVAPNLALSAELALDREAGTLGQVLHQLGGAAHVQAAVRALNVTPRALRLVLLQPGKAQARIAVRTRHEAVRAHDVVALLLAQRQHRVAAVGGRHPLLEGHVRVLGVTVDAVHANLLDLAFHKQRPRQRVARDAHATLGTLRQLAHAVGAKEMPVLALHNGTAQQRHAHWAAQVWNRVSVHHQIQRVQRHHVLHPGLPTSPRRQKSWLPLCVPLRPSPLCQ